MAEGGQVRLRRPRHFSERRDVLNEFSASELIRRYRLDRAEIIFVIDLVRANLTSSTARNRTTSAELKVIVTLRFLATGKMQLYSSDVLGLPQQSVSRIITETLSALSSRHILAQFIKFPITPNETQRKKSTSCRLLDFPE